MCVRIMIIVTLKCLRHQIKCLTLEAPTLQNGQTHSKNLSAVADELFECVWPFCGIVGISELSEFIQNHKSLKIPFVIYATLNVCLK